MAAPTVINTVASPSTATSLASNDNGLNLTSQHDPASSTSLVQIQPHTGSTTWASHHTLATVTTTLSAIDGAWIAFLKQLEPWEREFFVVNDLRDLSSFYEKLRQDAETQSTNSKRLKLARTMQPGIQILNNLSPIFESALSASPVPATPILGAFRYILDVPEKFLEMHESISSDMNGLIEQVQRLEKYQRHIFHDDLEALLVLYDVFLQIFNFFRVNLHVYYDKNGVRTLKKLISNSLLKQYPRDIEPAKANIEASLKKFENLLKFRTDRATLQVPGELRELRKTIERFENHVANHGAGHSPARPLPRQSIGPVALFSTLVADSSPADLSDANRKYILKSWLPHVDFEREHAANASRSSDTAIWIFDDDIFKNWTAKEETKSICVVQGDSGCGKSFLAASIVDRLRAQTISSQELVVNIYCKALDAMTADSSFFFGSILRQILLQDCSRLADSVLFADVVPISSRPPTVSDLKTLAVKISKLFSTIYVVIDGIDEYQRHAPDKFGSLCGDLHSFASECTKSVQLLTLVRPNYDLFNRHFQPYPRIKMNRKRNTNDMVLFMKEKLFTAEEIYEQDTALRSEVQGKLLNGANGNFLWLSSQVPSLHGLGIKQEIIAAVDELPADITSHFIKQTSEILRSSRKWRKERAIKMLLWVCNCGRRLSKAEMTEMLAIEPGTIELNKDALNVGNKSLTEDTRDLVVLQEGFYRPMHKSLEEWLQGLTSVSSSLVEELAVRQTQIHHDIAMSCLTYLQFDKFRNPNHLNIARFGQFERENPFYKYAARFWGFHFKKAGRHHEDLRNLACRFLGSEDLRNLAMQSIVFNGHFGFRLPQVIPKTTPLHILAIFGLVELAAEWPGVVGMITTRDGYQPLPLDYALANGERAMSHWILEQTLQREAPFEDTYAHFHLCHAAAQNGWHEIVDVLHALHADLDCRANTVKATALHVACREGSKQVADALIKAGARLNLQDAYGSTPLCEAIKNGHTSIVLALLDADADGSRAGAEGYTPLHLAAMYGNVRVIEQLTAKNIDIDARTDISTDRMHAIHVAAGCDQHKALRMLLPRCDIDIVTDSRNTALTLAIANSALESANLLLDNNADCGLVSAKSTALHLAATKGETRLCRRILDREPSLLYRFDNEDNSVLMCAIKRKHTDTCLALIDLGASVKPKDDRSMRPLHLAIAEGLSKVCHAILKWQPCEASTPGLCGFTAIHVAALHAARSLIKSLAISQDLNLNARSINGETAVHVATRKKDLAFLEELHHIQQTHFPNQEIHWSAQDDDSITALHIASENGATDCVEFLLQQGVESTEDSSSNTPFHLAASGGHLDCVKALMPSDVNLAGYQNQTALFKAAFAGHIEVLVFLHESGADLNLPDAFHVSPLHAAICSGRKDVASYLISHAAKVNTKAIGRHRGSTPLHAGAMYADYNVVKMLLDRGSDAAQCDDLGVTPFALAVQRGSIERMQLFEEKSQHSFHTLDIFGRSNLHFAVLSGNIKALEDMMAKTAFLGYTIETPDFLGDDLLICATKCGDLKMVQYLLQLGSSVDGGPTALKKPIHVAVDKGHLAIFMYLLDAGSNVDEVDYLERTALMHAVSKKSPIMLGQLLSRGADVKLRDAFGKSIHDYLALDAAFWKTFDLELNETGTPSHAAEIMWCHAKIIQTLRDFLQQPDQNCNDIHGQMQRHIALDQVADALWWLYNEDEFYARESMLMMAEWANIPPSSLIRVTWICAVCMRAIDDEAKFKCTDCGTDMCRFCHDDTTATASDRILSAPEARQQWELLESTVRAIADRCVLSNLAARDLHTTVFVMLPEIGDYMHTMLKKYEEWSITFGDNPRWRSLPCPGFDFLKLMAKIHQILELDDGKDGQVAEDLIERHRSLVQVEQELLRYNEGYVSRVTQRFGCSGHRYVPIEHHAMDPNDTVTPISDGPAFVSRSELERIVTLLEERQTTFEATDIANTQPTHDFPVASSQPDQLAMSLDESSALSSVEKADMHQQHDNHSSVNTGNDRSLPNNEKVKAATMTPPATAEEDQTDPEAGLASEVGSKSLPQSGTANQHGGHMAPIDTLLGKIKRRAKLRGFVEWETITFTTLKDLVDVRALLQQIADDQLSTNIDSRAGLALSSKSESIAELAYDLYQIIHMGHHGFRFRFRDDDDDDDEPVDMGS